ncbi:CBS domain-containing protein [Exiguobacterium flavidum]|uniref:CBS domain-containing protein n=1 Tax=Exiguobacterium flavidum TaxID=2184695 RepID=UPI000DF7AEE2|nr:CBS domain-containing protein [Exiguobacterium flavidum]
MAGDNAKRFLATFNRIEAFLGRENSSHRGFMEMVEGQKRHNSVLRRHEAALRRFSQLRNAIVHYQFDVEVFIAEPHDETVAEIERIHDELVHPPRIERLLKTVDVVRESDSLVALLKLLDDKNYSQFPVIGEDRRFLGLVTTNGIANWFARNASDAVGLKGVRVADVLRHEEKRGHYAFVSRKASLYEARDLFLTSLARGRQLNAVFVTENGKEGEKLLGILTSWDVLSLTEQEPKERGKTGETQS